MKWFLLHVVPAGIVFLLLGSVIAYQYMQVIVLTQQVNMLTTTLSSTTAAFSIQIQDLSNQLITIKELRNQTQILTNDISNTEQNIDISATKIEALQ